MLAVPYVGPIGRPMGPGLTTRVVGSIPVGGRRFNVNFQCGPSINPRDDVAFHLGVDVESKNITMNNIFGNQWGPQEYHNGNPTLHPAREFTLEVSCETGGFQVKINGDKSAKFEHRTEPSRITHIAIDGDIMLYRIDFNGGSVANGGAPIGFAVGGPCVPPPYPAPVPPVVSTPYPVRYPSPGPPHPQQPGAYPQQPNPYPHQPGGYPQQPSPYPPQPSLYPQQPGAHPQQTHGLYPQQPGMYPQGPHSPSMQHKQKKGLMDKIGVLAGGAVTGVTGLAAMKQMKKQAKISKKAKKKALKYGLPLAGAGLGVYALKKTHGFGFGHSSSSSSSSSSSDSD